MTGRTLRLALALLVAAPLAAQAPDSRSTRWDFTAGTGDVATTVSAGAMRWLVNVADARLRLGLGVRATSVFGDHTLTPAGAHDVPAGVIDTLRVSAFATMLNLAGHVEVRLADRLGAGLNIDLAGFGFGSSRNGSYRASATAAPSAVNASPSGANLFLYGSKDRGSLNSEFYGSWRATDRVMLRAGLSHQLVEYSAERELSSNTQRFRQYSNLMFASVRLTR